MKTNSKKMIIFGFCCLALILLSGDAYAADVLQTVRNKAAKFIHDLRPLIFILAGFGLIGFAFGAIFGKISWKWFANIAIGLFLVANVGLFIDYFATRSGAAGQYAEALGYGKYLDASGGYTATEGSISAPQSQNVPNANGEGNTENNNSDDMNKNCIPGTGYGCDTGNNYDVDGGNLNQVEVEAKDYSQEKQSCQLTGGKWNSETMTCENDFSDAPGWNGIGISGDSAVTANQTTDNENGGKNALTQGTPNNSQISNIGTIFDQISSDENGTISSTVNDVK